MLPVIPAHYACDYREKGHTDGIPLGINPELLGRRGTNINLKGYTPLKNFQIVTPKGGSSWSDGPTNCYT